MAGQGMAPGGVADQVVAVGRLRPTGVRLKDLSALSGPGTAVSVRTIAASRDSSAAVVADADRLHRGGPRPATAACLRRRSTGPLISSSGTRAPFWGTRLPLRGQAWTAGVSSHAFQDSFTLRPPRAPRFLSGMRGRARQGVWHAYRWRDRHRRPAVPRNLPLFCGRLPVPRMNRHPYRRPGKPPRGPFARPLPAAVRRARAMFG